METTELRLMDADESLRKGGQQEIRSLPEGQRHRVEGYSYQSWSVLPSLGCLWKSLTILSVLFSPVNLAQQHCVTQGSCED